MRRFLVLCCMAVLAAACAPSGQDDSGRMDVVASFAPLAEAAERIGNERVRVVDLTPAGAEPHDLELTTRSLDRLLDADVVLYIGGGFQPSIEESLGKTEGLVLDVLDGLPLREGNDPHVWLDPVLWSRVATNIGRALARADREGTDDFREASAAYVAELDALHGTYEQGLTRCERDLFVTSHDAFGYLADRYDLRTEAIAGISPEAEPDPKRMAEVADVVAERGVTTIFTETLVSPKVAESLARQTGVETAVLDPLESLPDGGYVGGMRANLRALRKGLGCR